MRTRFFSIFLCCISIMSLAALPKVAIFDAVLPEKMEKDIAIGITEKISEELVGSGKFTVLDRTSVSQSLKEFEFQMSGLVSDAEVRKAGERLGAAYIVVVRVSFVTDTYFISAKMIDVRTGEITVQASDEEEGKASITLKIAKRVGSKLAGETVVLTDSAKKNDVEIKSVKDMPVQSGLIAWYKFDETSGTVAADSSGNGKNGTLVGGVSWVPGKIGNAVFFSKGYFQYIKLPEGLVSSLKDCTVACWVKFDSVKKWCRIFDFGSGKDNYMFLTPKGENDGVDFAITTNGYDTGQKIQSNRLLSVGKWKHIAITLSDADSAGILYIDGIEAGRNDAISIHPSDLGKTWGNSIGKSQYEWDPFLDGQVDDFRIYNRALNASEIAGLFSAAK